MPVIVNTVVQPYRPPVYTTNQLVNQSVILPNPNLAGIIQGYPTYPMYPTYSIYQQEPIVPTIQVQATPTTIVKERYLPSPPIHCHSPPRVRNQVTIPSTIIKNFNTPPATIHTSPKRHIQIRRTRNIKFPESKLVIDPSCQPALQPAMKTITTINRTTRRTTTKGQGRR
nr:uncharacterized protein I206_03638 [Kwoniella pini CBS 10737]OCF50319.1 hypothetical protein I206_03638 [Kwoniella pini CBS 10737]